MIRAIQHFRLLANQQLKARLEYKGDFLIQLVFLLLEQAAWLVFVWTLFLHVPDIHGWGFWEVVFLYGLATIPLGLTTLFFEGGWRLPGIIHMGELDRLLIRPIDPIVQVFSLDVGIHGISNVVLGSWILIQAGFHLSERLPWWSFFYVLIIIVCSTIIHASVLLLTASVSFWVDNAGTSIPFMVKQVAEYSRFPLSLYPQFLSNLITWILPFAFTGFIPASFLLGHGKEWLGLVTPLVAFATFILTRTIFRFGLHRYESTGH
jgi:ABC-2 type transport system permease protein